MEDYFWLIVIGIVILIIIIISSLHSHDNNHIEYKDKNHKNHNVNKTNKNNSVNTNPYIFRETHSIENIYDYDRKEQEQFGKAGENYVASMLESIAKNHKAKVFNDYTFMDDNGFSTNIDHILVCQGGVFIIETKSNKGYIYGNDSTDKWYAEKEEWQEDKVFKNPVKQNQGHINHLRRMFKNTPPKMISMIIFPAAGSLLHVNSKYVYYSRDARNYILEKISEAKYSPQFVDRISNQLKDIIDEYGITTEEHKYNINNRFN